MKRIQTTTALFVAAIFIASAAIAAERDSQSATQSEQASKNADATRSSTEPSTTSSQGSGTASQGSGTASGSSSATVASTQGRAMMRGSTLVGADIRDKSGQKVGDIEDLILDGNSGRITHAIISAGGFLGMGSQLTPVPIQLLERSTASTTSTSTASSSTASSSTASSSTASGASSPETRSVAEDTSERTGQRAVDSADSAADRSENREQRSDTSRSAGNEFVINVDQATLKGAPHFENSNWPNFEHAWSQSVMTHYKVQSQASDSKEPMQLVRLSKLLDANLVDKQGGRIGEFEDTVIQSQGNRVSFAVVSVEKEGINKLTAVPFQLIRQGDQTQQNFVFNGDRAKLNNAPSFGATSYPDFNESGWAEGVLKHYQLESQPMAMR